MIEISYQLCFYADCLITESCIFLFGNRKLCAIGKRELEPAYIGDVVGIDEIALMTAQKQPAVFLFKHGDRMRDLDLFFGGHHNTVLAAVRRLDADDRIGKKKVIRPVQAVEVDSPSVEKFNFCPVQHLVKVEENI